MLMTFVIVVVAFVVGAILIGSYSTKKRREGLATMNATSPGVDCGTYVSGHPEIVGSPGITLSCNSHDFLLVSWNGALLGRIPRHAVTGLDVADKSKVETDKRYTVTRIALLGVFALAAPKTTTKVENIYLLAVEWNLTGLSLTTYFRFSMLGVANTAAGFLARHRLAEAPVLVASVPAGNAPTTSPSSPSGADGSGWPFS